MIDGFRPNTEGSLPGGRSGTRREKTGRGMIERVTRPGTIVHTVYQCWNRGLLDGGG